ncbi:hypothetical protein J2W20_001417 [Sinomonas atrocyanea]|uniref:hypothetical protein n=2 Tax=Sinomonas atrocyanea TaxID=37927 RepID=UPI002782B64B|nr:hypothetical protein [Sinomonas atrocyanea]MDQ0259526.1 hypothetical protein [Sinomonas atrocyanea]
MMTESSEPVDDRRHHPEETTVQDQVRDILAEALASPRLPGHAKARLRAILAEYPDRPEEALLEHLRLIRTGPRLQRAGAPGVLASSADQPPVPPLRVFRLPEPAPAS